MPSRPWLRHGFLCLRQAENDLGRYGDVRSHIECMRDAYVSRHRRTTELVTEAARGRSLGRRNRLPHQAHKSLIRSGGAGGSACLQRSCRDFCQGLLVAASEFSGSYRLASLFSRVRPSASRAWLAYTIPRVERTALRAYGALHRPGFATIADPFR